MRRLLLFGVLAALFVPASTAATRPLVLIAVIDSGITPSDLFDPELVVQGYNALDGSTHTDDEFGHGNYVAFQLAQVLGFAPSGICYECRLLPVKVGGASGVPSLAAMADGLRWAADHGARVINMSISEHPFSPRNERLESAISYALDRGAVVILSAGNNGSADPTVNKAASDLPEAIAVAAARSSNELEPDSNHGSWVPVAAIADSTSLAAPQVSAAAAEVLSWRPELSRAEVTGYLRAGCFPAPALDVGWHCLIDAFDALTAAGFDAEQWAGVRVTVGGDGKGTVSARGSSIVCGDACADRLRRGTELTLSATPALGSTFTGWSGDCSGSRSTCALTVSGDLDVTSHFSRRHAALRVRRVGLGTVRSAPAGISCGRQCTALFTPGVVHLVARAGRGYRFGRWEGDCRGTKPVCTVRMTSSRSVVARFAPRT